MARLIKLVFISEDRQRHSQSPKSSNFQGHSAAGRIRSVEKSNDLIGIWTRDFPACSIVPLPTTLPRAPQLIVLLMNIIRVR
jgi:hypothetical protein